MVIGVDLDSTLADLMPQLILFHNREYHTNHTLEDYIDFNWTVVWKVSKHEMLHRWQKFLESPEYMRIQPIEGSVQAIKELSKTNELFVVTSRVEELQKQTYFWVTQNYGKCFKDILFSNQYGNTSKTRTTKSKLCKDRGIQLMIEDHVEFAFDCASENITVFLPWNRNKILPPTIKRMQSWKEILEHV